MPPITWRREPLSRLGGPPLMAAPWMEAVTLAALALAMRLLFLLHNGALVLPDGYGRYLPVGEAFFQHWRGTVFDTPGYPFLVGAVYELFGRGFALMLVQHVLGAMTVLFVWAIARRLGMRRGAFYLGLYQAMHPAGILFANTALAETLFTFLLMAAVWLFASGQPRIAVSRAAAMGLVLGLAALTRANGALAWAVCGAILLASGQPRSRWLPTLAFALAGLAPIGAWVAANHAHHGIWAISQGSGWQLLQNTAYAELFDPSLLSEDERARYQDWRSLGGLRTRMMTRAPRGSPEAAQIDRRFRELAVASLKANPGGYLAAAPRALLLPRRFLRDATGYASSAKKWAGRAADTPQPWRDAYCRPLNQRAPYNLLYGALRGLYLFLYKHTVLLLALIAALWLAFKNRNALLLLAAALPLCQAAALQAALNPIDRYYYPFESLMVLCFSASVALYRRRRGPASPPAAAADSPGDVNAGSDHGD